MDYAWTLKVTKNDGSDQYTHLVDEGLFIKYALKKAILSFIVGGVRCRCLFFIVMIILSDLWISKAKTKNIHYERPQDPDGGGWLDTPGPGRHLPQLQGRGPGPDLPRGRARGGGPAVLYCTVLYCTALYCVVLYCTVL